MTTADPSTMPAADAATPARRTNAALRRLVEVTAWRAGEAASIADEHTRRTQEAREAYEQAISDADAGRGSDLERLEKTIAERRAELEATFDREEKDERQRSTRERAAAVSRLDEAASEARQGLKDSEFLADAVSDAGRQQPAQEVERVRVESARELGLLDELEREARRLAGPRVPFPHAQPDEDELRKADAPSPADPEGPADAPPLDRLMTLRADLEQRVAALDGVSLHAFIRAGGIFFAMFFALLAGASVALARGGLEQLVMLAGLALGAPAAVLVLMLPVRAVALAQTRRRVVPIAADLRRARVLAREAVASAIAWKRRVEAEIEQRQHAEVEASRRRYERRLNRIEEERRSTLEEIDRKHQERTADIESRRANACSDLDDEHAQRLGAIDQRHRDAVAELERARHHAIRTADEERDTRWAAMAERWRNEIAAIDEDLRIAKQLTDASCPPWTALAASYTPPLDPAPPVRFGRLSVRLEDLPGGRPEEPELLEGLPAEFHAPALLDLPGVASLSLLCAHQHRESALATLRAVMLRLLTSLPPAKARLTMIDPVGLGQSFAGFMRLADHDEKLVSSRIWTDPRHIEQRLADLTEHMETVIQKYLRNEFDSIESYNAEAGEIAEPYRFLVIADFPTGFSEEACRRLTSILESGPRCGVFTLIHADPNAKLPETFHLEAITGAGGAVLRAKDSAGFSIDDGALGLLPLKLEPAPDEPVMADLLASVGAAARTADRVEVPFDRLAPQNGELWSGTAAEELRLPLGRAGATRHQEIALGRGTSQHALVAGKTGSGKSTLLHVLITNAGLWLSPREIELYLVDFKKGVEFKAYAGGRLPHARAVAVESDREFGLSVLQRLDGELKRRGDLFRSLGVQSLAAARAQSPEEHLPRALLVIDEFQEFFTEDDQIAQDAALLLDRLVRQGRAFGMHVLLGSQTLSGAYTLARSTVGQMAVRIALQCSETDSYLILSEDNGAARLLSRPGEAIYNDANGLMEGNSPFQVAWLPDQTRDASLARIRQKADAEQYTPPTPQVVFEGNVPADFSKNAPLRRWLETQPSARERPAPLRAWIGEPVAIKEATAGVLSRQAGSNLLIVGQQDETSRAMVAAAAMGLIAQMPPARADATQLFLIDATPPDDPQFGYLRDMAERAADAAGVHVRIGGPREAAGIIAEIDAERGRRGTHGGGPSSVLMIHGLQRVRSLRRTEDEFSFSFSAPAPGEDDEPEADTAKQFAEILREGPGLGIHTIAWCDTAGNLARALDRGSIGEFEQRAVLQMSVSDSSTLIDSPAAGRLGMNRGLLFNEELGTLEKFRPYSLPSDDLIEWVAERLRNRDRD